MPELRRQHRVSFEADISIVQSDQPDSVSARAHNLSLSGMLVTAPEVPSRGTAVRCRMHLGDQRRELAGRVAWALPVDERTPPPFERPAAGIEFVDVAPHDSALLQRVVEPALVGPQPLQPVEVWFEGLPKPVRCEADVRADGLRVATRLPFLRVNSAVTITLVRQGVTEVRQGTLDVVTLDPSTAEDVPRLQIEISTPAPPDPGDEPTVVDAAPSALHAGEMTGRYPRFRMRRTAAAVAVAGAIVLGAFVVRGRPKDLHPVEPEMGATAPARATPPLPAPPAAPVAAPLPTPATSAASALSVTTTGGTSTIVLPVVGSTTGTPIYRLTNPPALALTLPRARFKLRPGIYHPGGAFGQVWVQARPTGAHVRLFYRPRDQRPAIVVERDAIRLILRRR